MGLRVGETELEDHGRNVEEKCVRNDHGEGNAQDVSIPHDEADQVEARVQDDGEARDHADPSYFSDGSADDPVALGHAVFQDETEGMQSDAPCGDKDALEVEARVAPEGIENPDR